MRLMKAEPSVPPRRPPRACCSAALHSCCPPSAPSLSLSLFLSPLCCAPSLSALLGRARPLRKFSSAAATQRAIVRILP